MKTTLALLLLVLLIACSTSETPKERPVTIQSWEVIGRDTCNRTDSKGRKQGKWLIFENKTPYKVIDTLYYKDGKIIPSEK